MRVIGIIHEGQIQLSGEVTGVCHVDYVLRIQLSTNYIVLRLLQYYLNSKLTVISKIKFVLK